MTKLIFLITILLSIIAGCNPAPNIDKSFDRSGQVMEIVVHTHTSQKVMYDALYLRTGINYKESGLQGLAIWSNSDNLCEVYIVEPKRINDINSNTLGHEMLHCLYGTYHKEK